MNTLKDYGKLLLTNTMSDLVEVHNMNTDGNIEVDNTLQYVIDTGIFLTGSEKVNNQVIGPHTSITITNASELSSITFSGFRLYFKSIHKIITDNIKVNISIYNDSKLHLIYVKPDKSTVVLESAYSGSEDYLLIARFVLKTDNTLTQFYVCPRNAGTNPYDQSGMKYEVLSGLQPGILENLKLKILDGIIKYSGINTSSIKYVDILKETFQSVAANIRYVSTDNTVDWNSTPVTDLITNKVLDYSTETLSTVTAEKFVCQKVYYDYMTKSLVIQYGSVVYETYNEALAGASNFNYNEPDFEGAYIPIAILVIKSGITVLTATGTFNIINITDSSSLSAATAVDPTAQALANTALTQAQSAQTTADSGVTKADAAQTDATSALANAATADGKATTVGTNLASHLADTNNPHSVTKSNIGLANVDNTSDTTKPLSTPQKTYVDGKVSDLTTLINGKASNSTQTRNVVKSTEPTDADYGRTKITGDLWLIP